MASTKELLGREEIGSDDDEPYAGIIRGRSFAVTGAGGSIGRALCRLIAHHGPAKLKMIDISERSLFETFSEIEGEAEPIIGDIRNIEKMKRLFQGVDMVVHCAALKHVNLCERNPDEAITTNIEGSWSVHEAARATGAMPVLLSTDKAVLPGNILGLTKAAAEGFWGGPIARLVNVMWSSGSLLPIVADRLVRGLPILIRGEDTARFFMTEGEAARAVMYASQYRGVTVPIVGKPVKVVDIVHRLAETMGRPAMLSLAELPAYEKGAEGWAWPYETISQSAPAGDAGMPLAGKKIIPYSKMAPMVDAARSGSGLLSAAVSVFWRELIAND